MPVMGAGTKADTLKLLFTSPQLSDIARVTTLTRTALEDIPTPNFSGIAANIKNCGLTK